MAAQHHRKRRDQHQEHRTRDAAGEQVHRHAEQHDQREAGDGSRPPPPLHRCHRSHPSGILSYVLAVARRESLSVDQARRITLAAQGFAEPRPTGRVDRRHLRKVFDRLGLVQMDSVNVLVRSHYLPLFSRLGPYDRLLLDRFVYDDHEAFEYWGHDASLIRADLHPLLRWRMAGDHQWGGMRRWLVSTDPTLLDALHRSVLAEGPISAGELDADDRKKGPWWGWSDTKRSLEHLFHAGRVGAVRRGTFERGVLRPCARRAGRRARASDT